MSVDSKDHRRFTENKLTLIPKEEPRQLLPQVESDKAVTGDAQFDKMIRVLQSKKNELTAHLNEVATRVCESSDPILTTKLQYEFHGSRGYLFALNMVLDLPAQILAESKPNLSI